MRMLLLHCQVKINLQKMRDISCRFSFRNKNCCEYSDQYNTVFNPIQRSPNYKPSILAMNSYDPCNKNDHFTNAKDPYEKAEEHQYTPH